MPPDVDPPPSADGKSPRQTDRRRVIALSHLAITTGPKPLLPKAEIKIGGKKLKSAGNRTGPLVGINCHFGTLLYFRIAGGVLSGDIHAPARDAAESSGGRPKAQRTLTS